MFKSQKLLGPFGAAVVANMLLGTTVIGYKFGFESLHPLVFAGMTYGLSGFTIGLFAGRLSHLRDIAILRKVLVNTGLMLAFVVLWVIGLDNSTAMKSAVLTLATPIFLYLLAAIFLHEQIIKRALVGCLIGLVGSIMIVGLPAVLQAAFEVGDVLLLLSYFCLAVLIIHTKHVYKWLQPAEIVSYRFFFTGALIFTFMLARLGGGIFEGAELAAWLALAYVVVVASLGVPLLYRMLAKMKAEAMAPTLYADPLAGTLAAALILNEVLEPGAIVGVAVVVAGLLISHPHHHHLYHRFHIRHPRGLSGIGHWLRSRLSKRS